MLRRTPRECRGQLERKGILRRIKPSISSYEVRASLAGVAELADARDLGSRGATLAGSIPVARIRTHPPVFGGRPASRRETCSEAPGRRFAPGGFRAYGRCFSAPNDFFKWAATAGQPCAESKCRPSQAAGPLQEKLLRNVPVVRAEQAGRAGLWRRGFSFLHLHFAGSS